MLEYPGRWWFLGVRMPVEASFWRLVGYAAKEWMSDKRYGAEAREREVRKRVAQWREARRRNLEDATYQAAERGMELIRLFLVHGGKLGWRRRLAELGISARTAQNLRALAQMRALAPKLFGRLATLGPTKLYRIARLNPDDWHRIDPDNEVNFGQVRGKLKHLTDEQLTAYLRHKFPVEKRTDWRQVRTRLNHLRRLVLTMPKKEHPELEDAVKMRDSARQIAGKLVDEIKRLAS